MVTFSFEEVWEGILPQIRAYGIMSVGYHDAQDIMSEFSVFVDNKVKVMMFNDFSHAKGYFVLYFKRRTVDFVRKRNTYSKLKDLIGEEEVERMSGSKSTMNLSKLLISMDVLNVADELGTRKVIELFMKGYGFREIGAKLGMGNRTAYRRFEETMIRARSLARLSYESSGDAENNTTRKEPDNIMASVKKKKPVGPKIETEEMPEFAVAVEGNKIVVSDENGNIVATATAKDDQLATLTIKSKAYKDRQQEIIDLCETKAEEASKGTLASGGGKAKTPKAKVNPDLDPRDPIDLSTVKDFPDTLEKWVKKCGGEGYDLAGSGTPVARRFKPGGDAKLKAALKRVSSPSAKAIAAELGWSHLINWSNESDD